VKRARLSARFREGKLDVWLVALVALAVRLALVLYAAGRFPPADDGAFYHVVAQRIARGEGYTWLWPDGAITYAAHYPVGYPALIGAAYALFGPAPGIAMLVNALIGGIGAVAVHSLASREGSRTAALFAGALAALAPGLVFYTPALMTEANAGLLLAAAFAVALGTWPGAALLRTVLAAALLAGVVLLRPQIILLAPVLGFLGSTKGTWARARGALVATGVCVALCLPWTVRNCRKMDACAFVSANGGWNLFIGSSPAGEGGFAPVDRIGIPEECKTVFGEASKDRCFGNAGLRRIAADPLAWLALVPKKLGQTFNYGTASAHYLSSSNGSLVNEPVKIAIGAVELLGQRLLVLAALFGLARAEGPRRRARRILAAMFAVFVFLPPAWLAWMGVISVGALLGRSLFDKPAACFALATLLTTAASHAVFFGAARYALVCLPALALLAAAGWPRPSASPEARYSSVAPPLL
jgi:4-amino-4-deoxy-L-arabinose transferase-like glycosyltransferase